MVRLESIRTLIALSVQHGLQLHQIDVTTAFLNGGLEEEVFMSQAESFVVKDQEHLVCKLKKSLYRLKQVTSVLHHFFGMKVIQDEATWLRLRKRVGRSASVHE